MNIIDFTDKFQKIEIENNFFAAKDSKGLLYWDIVRYEVFSSIYNELASIMISESLTPKKTKQLIKKRFIFFKNYCHFRFKTRTKKYNYINFIASRNVGDEEVYLDFISDDILKIIKDESLIIETYAINDNQASKYESILDYGLLFENYRMSFFSLIEKKKSFSHYDVSNVLKENFGTNIDFDLKIDDILSEYHLSYSYYIKLFKRIKPKIIFLVQNGICKGIFSAANFLKIPIVELQHAAIGYVHPAYSYPKEIKKGMLNSLPNFFFSFSDFWLKKTHFPVDNAFSIGNSFYSTKKKVTEKKYDLTFIFANLYTKDLMKIIDELILFGYKNEICIKLHPNQIDEVDYIANRYSPYNNIHIISNQISITDVLLVSNAIVAVQSTCVYEALHHQIKIFIIKIKNYQCNQDVFDNSNVYLIDTTSEIISLVDNEFITSNQNIIFDDFKENIFLNFLSKFKYDS